MHRYFSVRRLFLTLTLILPICLFAQSNISIKQDTILQNQLKHLDDKLDKRPFSTAKKAHELLEKANSENLKISQIIAYTLLAKAYEKQRDYDKGLME